MKKLSLEELNRSTIEEYKKTSKLPIIIVLDNIRSMVNVGSTFRIADSFLIESIYLCGITAKPPHREIHKTALGAEDSVQWKYFSDTNIALKQLKFSGYKIIGIEQTDESIMMNLYKPTKNEKFALVYGNEVEGISDNALSFCDFCIEIPQFGTKHSLNVSTSIAISSWEISKFFLKDL